jgi:hypothetical protein
VDSVVFLGSLEPLPISREKSNLLVNPEGRDGSSFLFFCSQLSQCEFFVIDVPSFHQ